jgi:hypothetical protein
MQKADKVLIAKIAATAAMVLGLGIIIGWGLSQQPEVEVVGWIHWTRGVGRYDPIDIALRGRYPAAIRHNGVFFDCIPQSVPSDIGTVKTSASKNAFTNAQYHQDMADRWSLFGKRLDAMMETDEKKEEAEKP